MTYTIPPFPVFKEGDGCERFAAGLPSDYADKVERLHNELRAHVSREPSRLEEYVCNAVQDCYDLLIHLTVERRGNFMIEALEERLPATVFEIALDCGWLPPRARVNLREWREWVKQLASGRYSRVGLDPNPRYPYLFIAFPDNDSVIQEAERQTLPANKSRKRGPNRDYETALRVARVVADIAPDGAWRSKLNDKLENICVELDEQKVPRPKTWKNRGYSDWSACMAGEPHLVVKAIQHHLKLACEKPSQPSP